MDIKEARSGEVDPSRHWYYRTKILPVIDFCRRALAEKAPLDLIDIGAGSGFFCESVMGSLSGKISDVVAVDRAYEEDRSWEDPRVRGRVFWRRELPGEARDSIILLMDVLEHIEDDAGFLRGLVSRCRGRNYVFVTVPAFRALWSGHDEFLGHRRRYSLGSITKLLRDAGVSVTSRYYLYAAVFPFAFMYRKAAALRSGRRNESDLKPVPAAVSWGLEWICRAEFPCRRLNRFFGLTCVVEGRIG